MRDARLSGRQIVTIVAIVAAAALIAPVAVQAAATLVKIQDADSPAKAQVEGGKLRVGDGAGAMTVDGSVGVAKAFDSPAQPYQESFEVVCSGATANDTHSVPANKLLVIDRIEFTLNLGTAMSVLETTFDGDLTKHVAFVGITAADDQHNVVLEDDGPIGYADGGTTLAFDPRITSTTQSTRCSGGGLARAVVVGYLVNP